MEDQREVMLRAASTLLRDEGPEALTVRRIAAAAECSTMGVYSRFGGKDGVVDALFREGFELLHDTLDAVEQTDDPVADLARGARAYRDLALAHDTHYAIMFAKAVPGFEASAASREVALGSFLVLVRMVERATDAGQLEGDPTVIAAAIWATVHGIASLEISGARPEPAVDHLPLDATIGALLRGFAPAR